MHRPDLKQLRTLVGGLPGKRVTVMGLGRFGGGAAAVRFLASRGASVTVTDLKEPGSLEEAIRSLNDYPVEFHLGGHRESDFVETDLVLANPAVKPGSEYLRLAAEHDVACTTEMNVFFALCRAPISGVTGSNGKSTTTAMLAGILEAAGRRVWLGGNIGRPLVEQVEAIQPGDSVVVELSSFMLHWLGDIGVSPSVAVVTNLSANHLDWHGGSEEYARAKFNILANQRPGAIAVLNAAGPEVAKWAADARGEVRWFGLEPGRACGCYCCEDRLVFRAPGGEVDVMGAGELPVPGRHNVENALAASAAALALGVSAEDVATGLRRFKSLEHRLEKCAAVGGVTYYNDSIATTPQSAIAALQSFQSPVTVICGGYDKGQDLTDFARECALRARHVIAMGKTGPVLAELVERCAASSTSSVEVHRAAGLEEAVQIARRVAERGGIVLLSPACASYDMFENYEHRGRSFRYLVRMLETDVACT